MRRCLLSALALWSVAAWSGPASRDEVLAAVYPGASIRAERVFLTEAQVAAAARLSGTPVESALVARYLARKGDRTVGRAYVDTHVVRTKRESLLVCLDREGAVRRVEVLAFLEPRDYLAPRAFYEQYGSRRLEADLRLQQSIRSVAGATLTCLATNRAVRRVLAIDRILSGKP